MNRFFLILLFLVINAQAWQGQIWKAHDHNRPQPQVVTPGVTNNLAPSDAIILFDGNGMGAWKGTNGKPLKWADKGDYFECVAGAGYIQTKEAFGDVQLHIEWASPAEAKGQSQGRGNSGVFLMGEYEVQVLDSYNNTTYPDGQAAAIYGQSPPAVNASKGPGEWQSYDIIFHRPHFNTFGDLLKPAVLTVFHNGVLVQDHFELLGGTEWLIFDAYQKHADRLPLSLQDHDNPVRFRNIWVRDLEAQKRQLPSAFKTIALSDKDMQKYIGKYESENGLKIEIFAKRATLFLNRSGRVFELAAHSKASLSAIRSAIDLNFDFDDNAQVKKVVYQFDKNSTTCFPLK